MIDTRIAEYVLALQNEQSLSRAAEKLFITPSALKQQINKLESELKTPLFVRNGHTLSLTAAGSIYVAGAHAILDVKKQAEEQIQTIHESKHDISSIRIAMNQNFQSFFETSIYPQFVQLCPTVELTPVIVTDTSAKQEVVYGHADLAFVISSGVIASSLENIPIRKETLHLAFPAELADISNRSENAFETVLEEIRLRGLGFIGTPLGALGQAEKYYLNRIGLTPEILCYATSFQHLRTLLNHQFACAVIPECAIEKTDTFAHLPLVPDSYYLLDLVYGRKLPMTNAVKKLICLFLEIFDSVQGTKSTLDALLASLR